MQIDKISSSRLFINFPEMEKLNSKILNVRCYHFFGRLLTKIHIATAINYRDKNNKLKTVYVNTNSLISHMLPPNLGSKELKKKVREFKKECTRANLKTLNEHSIKTLFVNLRGISKLAHHSKHIQETVLKDSEPLPLDQTSLSSSSHNPESVQLALISKPLRDKPHKESDRGIAAESQVRSREKDVVNSQQLPSTIDFPDDSWQPPSIPLPLNEQEKKLRAAKQEIIAIAELNPHRLANRRRIYYKIGGCIPGPDPRGYSQCSESPWETALKEGNLQQIEMILSNPYFKPQSKDLEKAIAEKNVPLINKLIANKHIDLSTKNWSANSASFLLSLIQKGLEESITVLLDHGYDVNLLEDDFDQTIDYQTLSDNCKSRIQQARQLDQVNNEGHTNLEQAILKGDIEAVQQQMNLGACVNHKDGRPLLLAIKEYMRRIPKRDMLFTIGPCTTPEELAKRRKIIKLVLAHPHLKISERLWPHLCPADRPDKWEKLIARFLKRQTPFWSAKEFVDYMQLERLPENSPILAALSVEQNVAIEQDRNLRFMKMIFETSNDGHMQAEVYLMLQKLWGSLKNSKIITENFCQKTVEKLTSSIQNIPVVFRAGGGEKLLQQLNDGLPIIIPAGWTGHATSIVFYKDKLILGNRGDSIEGFQHGLHIYSYSSSRLTANILEQLAETHEKKPLSLTSSREWFEKRLVQDLDARKIEMLPMTSQITGNCTWASSAYLGFLSALYALANEFDHKTAQEVHKFGENTFEPAVKLMSIEKYISDYKKNLYIADNKFGVKHDSYYFETLFMKHYKQIKQNADPHQVDLAYKIIDALVFSGLEINLFPRTRDKNTLQQADLEIVEWLEKRYQMPWNERLSFYLNREELDFSYHPFSWIY